MLALPVRKLLVGYVGRIAERVLAARPRVGAATAAWRAAPRETIGTGARMASRLIDRDALPADLLIVEPGPAGARPARIASVNIWHGRNLFTETGLYFT